MQNYKICVSVIIPLFEREQEIKKLLTSFKKLDFSERFEIIIIDDGSKNYKELEQAIKEVTPTTLFMHLKKNVGPSKARNIGVKKAQGEFLWFLDSDTEVTDNNLLKTLVNCLRKDKNLKGVGGEFIEINNNSYIIKNHFYPNWLLLTKPVPLQDKVTLAWYPQCVSANNLLVRKKDFLTSKGFSSWLTLYEDVDLCLQISHLGKSFLTRSDTIIIHHHSLAGREGGKFSFYSQMWKYVLALQIGRVKILFLHFPWRLPVLPLLDIIFCPVVFFHQLFRSKVKTNELFKEKSKDSPRSFAQLVLFNLMAMFCAWLYACFLIFKKIIK